MRSLEPLELPPIASRSLTGAWLFAGLACLAAVDAQASSIESRLEVFDREAIAIARVVDDLRGQISPASFISPDEAAQRFDEAMFMQMVGEPEQASEQLYSLLFTGALTDAAMRRDAEWTYAESLFQMGNLQGAAERFAVVVADRDHPYREDAVRKLLGVYASLRDREAFEALYDREIGRGQVEPTGSILYALGRGRYLQDDLDGAERAFAAVPDDDPDRGRSEYFLGVIATRRGELSRAAEAFETVAASDVEQPLKDRAQLSLGRLFYHAGNYSQAAKHYAEVSPNSELLDDKLYEMIWTSIRQEHWPAAIDNVEIFLMVFPDHEYAAQLLLLRGHLHVQAEDWESALSTYDQVLREYRPVHDRFRALAQPGSRADAEVREVVEQLEGAAGLPLYAVSMMREDPMFQRAIALFEDLEAQGTALSASERLVEDLAVFLRAEGLGSFTSMRVHALHQRVQIVEQRLALLDVQTQWLSEQPGIDAIRVAELQARRDRLAAELDGPLTDVENALSEMGSYERTIGERRAMANQVRERLDAMRDELSTATTRLSLQAQGLGQVDPTVVQTAEVLKQRIARNRSTLSELESSIVSLSVPQVLEDMSPDVVDSPARAVDGLAHAVVAEWPADEAAQLLLARIETTHGVLRNGYGELGDVLDAIGQAANSELGRLRAEFEREVSEVGNQRRVHDSTLTAARSMALGLTRQGFGELEDFFADSMLKADMGMVDVHWARKLERSDEIDGLRAAQETTTTELERRFRLIRAKLGEVP